MTPLLFTERPKEPSESKTRWKPGTIIARAQRVSAMRSRRLATLGLPVRFFLGDDFLEFTAWLAALYLLDEKSTIFRSSGNSFWRGTGLLRRPLLQFPSTPLAAAN